MRVLVAFSDDHCWLILEQTWWVELTGIQPVGPLIQDQTSYRYGFGQPFKGSTPWQLAMFCLGAIDPRQLGSDRKYLAQFRGAKHFRAARDASCKELLELKASVLQQLHDDQQFAQQCSPHLASAVVGCELEQTLIARSTTQHDGLRQLHQTLLVNHQKLREADPTSLAVPMECCCSLLEIARIQQHVHSLDGANCRRDAAELLLKASLLLSEQAALEGSPEACELLLLGFELTLDYVCEAIDTESNAQDPGPDATVLVSLEVAVWASLVALRGFQVNCKSAHCPSPECINTICNALCGSLEKTPNAQRPTIPHIKGTAIEPCWDSWRAGAKPRALEALLALPELRKRKRTG